MSRASMKLWMNRKYRCGKHTPDFKWPTVTHGAVCFKLTCENGQGAHYFDNWQQAYAMGWRSELPEAEIKFQKGAK